MKSKRGSIPLRQEIPIPANRAADGELHPAVRDMADLLAEIASRQLRKMQTALKGREN